MTPTDTRCPGAMDGRHSWVDATRLTDRSRHLACTYCDAERIEDR